MCVAGLSPEEPRPLTKAGSLWARLSSGTWTLLALHTPWQITLQSSIQTWAQKGAFDVGQR